MVKKIIRMKFLVFCALTSLFVALGAAQECLPYTERLDCHPGPFAGGDHKTECEAMGCTYCTSEIPDWNVPVCFLPKSYGYQMEGQPEETPDGVKVTLRRATSISMFGSDSETLTLEAEFQSNERLRIKITDGTQRYQVPLRVDPAPGGNNFKLYEVTFTNDPIFSFKVTRKSNGAVLFDTGLGGLTFSDQFLQISTKLPNENLFGIGENEQKTFRHHFEKFPVYALFAKDQAPDGNANMYGVHPYYTVLENDGKAHSVVFVNSNAQEFVLLPNPGVLYRTIGGVLDMYFFLGPTIENTVQQYNQAVGRTPIPPYWALGFQLCKYGYDNLETMQAAVDRTAQYNIPHDVIYGDIDIMDGRKDFTVSPDRFGGLPEYVRELKGRGIRFMTILDPAIAAEEPAGSYKPYDWGTELDIWIKRPDGTIGLGRVWPEGATAFPDYSKNTTREWWITLIKEFHEILEFDALWIDMNEPANFVTGDLNGCAENKWNNPPYTPKIRGGYLPTQTLCMDHVDSVSRHYDTHSIYGWFESEPTLAGVQAARPGKRGFVLSRSSFIGTGRWVSHWLGDNFSNWPNIKMSIIGMLQFNLFGIPFVGPDICGHNGDAEAELCQRWSELGAFYPFSRNHNGYGHAPQDPGAYGPEVAMSVRKALEVRYTLLPYLYTLFHEHSTIGGTVARALLHEFPTDKTAIDIDSQFLWGQGLMISPVLEKGQTSVNIYFPDARWYNYYDGTEVNARESTLLTDAPLDHINVHIRGGVIIPSQANATTTDQSRKNPFGLIVALDDNEEASGRLYYDDGELLDPVQSGQYFLASYGYHKGQLVTLIENNGWAPMADLTLDSIRLLGSPREYTSVTVDGAVYPVTTTTSGEVTVSGLALNPTIAYNIVFE